MYTTYIIYALCIGLLLWGGKFAGFKKEQFHSDCASLEITKSLRGFAAIGVILHHISQEDAFQYANMAKGWNTPGELSFFVNYGYKFVAIFFFCSGFGLIKSLATKPDYFNGFIKKRVVKTLVIPFYVNVLLYAPFVAFTSAKMPVIQWITKFTGLTLMNEYAWYPIVLTLLYLAFYFIFKNIKNRKVCFALMFVVIFLMGVFFSISGHRAWWAGPKNWWLDQTLAANAKWWMQERVIWFFGEWWVNSCIAFLVGMIFAHNEEKIYAWFKKAYWPKLLLVFIIYFAFNILHGIVGMKFGYWTEFNGQGPGILNKFVTYCSQLPQVSMYVILLYVILMKYHAQNPVSRFFGNISLETYMMNLIAISAFRFLLYSNQGWPITKPGHWNLAVYALAVFAATLLLAFIYKLCNKLVLKLFDRPKKITEDTKVQNETV
ncbi:MAG: acyltransferase [Treponema sp.]|nr:acyltransferase [Treponema sp.]